MLSVAQESFSPAPLLRPRGIAAAYGSAIRQTEDPREIEYRVLARATALLESASAEDAGPSLLPSAVHENRMVWTAFAADLAGEGNSLAETARARLISLARWIFAESDRVLRERKSPLALIDVNRAVMAGLRAAGTAPAGAG